MKFETQVQIAEHIANQDYGCSGVQCYGEHNIEHKQLADCPLHSKCKSFADMPEVATLWLKENKPQETEEPEEPKKFGDLTEEEQEVIRKAYAEGRCERLSDTHPTGWHLTKAPEVVSLSDVDRWGPYDNVVYRIKEPQHQSDGESGEQRNLKDLSMEEWRQFNKELGIEELREDVCGVPGCGCAPLPVETFESGAVRDTTIGKPRPELISPFFIERLAKALAIGAKKYDDDNWSKGIPMRRCLASLERHIMKFKMGKTDEDHLAAVACNIMFMIHFDEVRPDLNDMPYYGIPEREEE